MQLYKNKELRSNLVIKEVGGKTMKAMVVFAFCIEYIKDLVLDILKKAIHGLDDNDVHWVVTVPAIWNEQARQFMIEASAKAGIEKENLTLALEPECAALYCRYLAMDKQEHGDNVEIKAFDENARFMVVDLGGGTIDITMSEVISTGQLREIYNATGGPWGGNFVNDQIMKTLKEVIGWEVMRKFQDEDYDDYLEVLRQVEQIKRGVDHDSEFVVSIPKDLLTNINVPDSLQQDVHIGKKSITLSTSLIQKIFSSSVDSMIKHVEKLLHNGEACSVSTILLVGGYSSSKVIQSAFREKFEKKYRIIIPLTPDMIVLKGAVITGHGIETIVGRMAKYHYGLGLSAAAVSGRSISIGDNDNKTFFSLIKKGQKIKVGEVVTQYEVVLKAKSKWANLEMYTTKDDKPRTIIDNDHFTKIGGILVKLPQFKRESILILTISYDETEFKVVATDKNTGRCFVGTCRFLEKESN
ncbi:heat shock 70 kDa protein 12A-like [Mytilus trossulus]|uniref:heat shock 70 kDa protein 12A-like n=1 Tax=Mytilus trossulus TaxID=6551 RepID=UPI003004FE71